MTKISDVENDLDCLYERQVSFSCMSFHMAQECQLGKKNSGVCGHLRYAIT